MRLERQIPVALYGFLIIIGLYAMPSCSQNATPGGELPLKDSLAVVRPAAYATHKYFPMLLGKRIAIVANHTSMIGNTPLVDSLISSGVNVVKIFSPEHGYRGTAGAGEEVKDHLEDSNHIEVISLYGDKYKPQGQDLAGLDMVVFDIQDVGVRFYTYISTMHYVMEACAENNVPLLVLDRPNPNGYFVDGPVLNLECRSFVGLHPIPIVYGLTMAELALMINGEGWLKDSIKCDLHYILCANYTHDSLYWLSVPPSPNLQNMQAVYLYPSIGLFEGTTASVARGTEFPFLAVGFPTYPDTTFSFVPKTIGNGSSNPKYENEICYGKDFRNVNVEGIILKKRIELKWLIDVYDIYKKKDFFIPFLYNLAGNKLLSKQIYDGNNEDEIRKSWEPELTEYKKLRKKYLLYKDFE